jgi:hypothetical protein
VKLSGLEEQEHATRQIRVRVTVQTDVPDEILDADRHTEDSLSTGLTIIHTQLALRGNDLSQDLGVIRAELAVDEDRPIVVALGCQLRARPRAEHAGRYIRLRVESG